MCTSQEGTKQFLFQTKSITGQWLLVCFTGEAMTYLMWPSLWISSTWWPTISTASGSLKPVTTLHSTHPLQTRSGGNSSLSVLQLKCGPGICSTKQDQDVHFWGMDSDWPTAFHQPRFYAWHNFFKINPLKCTFVWIQIKSLTSSVPPKLRHFIAPNLHICVKSACT